jgi:uncharacterized protein YndB with AHSA1/START domain
MTLTVAPVRKQVVVDAPIEHAFRVFTDGFATWWPLGTHHLGTNPPVTVLLEGHVGGRCYERDAGGAETVWGHVRAWDPPRRLVFSWEISSDWRCDPSAASEVEVRFIAESAERTRVELEHRGLEVYGEKVQEVRDALGGEGGWTGILARFAAVAGPSAA